MNKKIAIGAAAIAVAVAIGAVIVTQGGRLKTAASVAQSAAMNEEQVAAKSDENAQMTQELQEEYQIPEITLTPEMQAAIADGSMTLEEAAAQLLSGGGTPSEATDSAETWEVAESAPEETWTASEQTQAAPEQTQAPPEETQAAPEETRTPPEVPTPTAEPEPEVTAPEETETAALSGETAPEPDAGQIASTPRADSGQAASPTKRPDAGQTDSPAKPADAGETQVPEKSAEEKAKEEANAKIQNLFAQLYVLRDSFNARIDGLIAECIAEFWALDPSQQTKINKVRIVYARMDAIEAMEAECDAKVESIAAQMDEIDPALGAKARQYYQNEKELKKASLISQYGGG